MANTSLYTHSETGGSVPLLGYIVFYTVTGERVPHASALASFTNDNYQHIGSQFPATAPKDVDVFRRIASAAKRTKMETGAENVYRNVLIRDVGNSDNTVTKRIVVEDRDRSGKKQLAYNQELDVEFNRTSGVVVTRLPEPTTPTGTASHALAEEVSVEIINDYNAWRGCLNSWAIREWLRAEIGKMNASVLKKGVYFVSSGHEAALRELKRFINLLPGASMFHMVEMIDDVEAKALIKSAYETEAQREMDELMAELGDAIATGRKTTQKGLEAKLRAHVHLTQKMQDYKSLLNDNLSLAGARLALLDEMMEDFCGTLKKKDDTDEDNED